MMDHERLAMIEKFLEEFTKWAEDQPEIHAVALVGSYANHTVTVRSDVDLVILVDEPNHFLQNTQWIGQFGDVEKQQLEEYGRVTSIRVWYQDGHEVEFGITDTLWGSDPEDAGTQQIIRGGLRILFDRDHCLNQHISDRQDPA